MTRLDEVFVPGRLPAATYVARDGLQLEDSAREAIEGRGRIVWLTGPPKSGKTVLVRKVAPGAIEMPVGDIRQSGQFWSEVVDRFRTGPTASRPPRVEARELLAARRDEVLFLDDFHHVPMEAQVDVLRGLKPLVFDGLRVIVGSISRRPHGSPALERELVGRAAKLEVPLWRREELAEIAERGFAALNAVADARDVDRLAFEALASPHRMQELCARLCRWNDLLETAPEPTLLRVRNWATLVRERPRAAAERDNVRRLRTPAPEASELRELRRLG